jgi:hypothetical protein
MQTDYLDHLLSRVLMPDTPKPGLPSPEEMPIAIVSKLWELASAPPERTSGRLQDQINACRMLYSQFGYQRALKRLSEIASMDASRTKGRTRDQEAAAKLLKKYLSAIKPDKSGVQ